MASMQAALDGREDGREDGRLARSQRTRDAIVDALRALHHDGDLRPTAPRVAERAGVSLRTVFQHFNDLETLLVAAGHRDLEIARQYARPIDPAADFATRLTEFVEQRTQMYESLSPVWRAARLQQPFSPQIRRNQDRLLEVGCEQLATTFATELDAAENRAAVLAALQAATTWTTWEFLRSDLHHDVDAARAAVRVLVTRLLTQP
ncbi:MAG: TetR family transcriptional regulator [Frankiales bacterium]|nr:TetR family transcriptional regulator [Frankiales bacterium]